MNEVAPRANNIGPAMSLGQALERMLADPEISAEKMRIVIEAHDKNLLRMREEACSAALARLAPKLPQIPKKGLVRDAKKNKLWDYSKFEHMHAHLTPLMAEEGFTIGFTERPCPWDSHLIAHVAVVTHESGHTFEAVTHLPVDNSGGKNMVQAHGSSSTYGARYSWRKAFNISWEGHDDDGVAAGTGLEKITDDQVAHLTKLIADIGGDTERRTQQVARLGDAETLADIRQRAYDRVKTQLERRKRGES